MIAALTIALSAIHPMMIHLPTLHSVPQISAVSAIAGERLVEKTSPRWLLLNYLVPLTTFLCTLLCTSTVFDAIYVSIVRGTLRESST